MLDRSPGKLPILLASAVCAAAVLSVAFVAGTDWVFAIAEVMLLDSGIVAVALLFSSFLLASFSFGVAADASELMS